GSVLELAPQAARRAEALHAHREAAALLRKAVERSRDPAPELLERLAAALYRSGQFEPAIGARQRAAHAWAAAGAARRQAANLNDVSRLSWLSGRHAESAAAHLQAVELVRALPPGPELAGAYEGAARVRFMEQDLPGAVEQ